MLEGSFEDSFGREANWTTLEVHDYDGEVHSGSDADEHLSEADRVFYEITVETTDGQETFYRWVAGPFETESDLEAAIQDEADHYAA
jgi:hypothetical protein